METCTNGSATVETEPICRCEIGVGGWMLTLERFGRVDFLPPMIYDVMETTINIDYTYLDQSGTFFLTVFTKWVWLAIFGLFLFYVLLKLCDSRFAPCNGACKPPEGLSRFGRARHWLMKHPAPCRTRKAVQSICAFFILNFLFNITAQVMVVATTAKIDSWRMISIVIVNAVLLWWSSLKVYCT